MSLDPKPLEIIGRKGPEYLKGVDTHPNHSGNSHYRSPFLCRYLGLFGIGVGSSTTLLPPASPSQII